MHIRPAVAADFSAMWPIFQEVVASESTYVFTADTSAADAYAYWFGPGVTSYVAEENGDVLAMYKLIANQAGLGGHVANASFMVAARAGKAMAVSGASWLDHEWSSQVLDADASGWDWTGANLDDGGALMAFQIRDKSGAKLWAHATWRDASGKITQFDPEQVDFSPQRRWRSPRTKAEYPVAMRLTTGAVTWQVEPLQDDQELDSRRSTGAVYWEGAVTLRRDGKPAGRGYLELTGYVRPMKL